MGDYDFPFMKKTKTLEQLQEENERLAREAENADLQLTREQRTFAYNKLREAGLSYKKDFGSSLKRLWRWANK